MENKKARWYGPKQIMVMIYTGILMFIASGIAGGNNNTVFPIVAEVRGWAISLLNVVSGIGCCLVAVGVIVFSRLMNKVDLWIYQESPCIPGSNSFDRYFKFFL